VKLLKQLRVAYILIGIVIVGGILIGTLEAQPIKNQLNAWKLLPQPERLTELYYDHSANLPASYTPGRPQSVSFTVHNLEYQSLTYHYSVTATPDGSTTATPLTSGTLKLAQNQYATVPLTITVPDLGPRVQVAIKLTSTSLNVNETIDYWVTRSAA